MSNPFERLQGRRRRVETRRSDTLQKIAARELGNATRWYELVAINRLLPPYLTDDPVEAGERVLLTGSGLLVPDEGAPVQASRAADPATTYGMDVALSDGLLMETEDGDFAVATGYDNLVQALKHRLDTDIGELVFHRDYGCGVRRLLGHGGTTATGRLAQALVRRAVASDPRVADARGVTATISGDVLTVTGTAVAVDGSTIPLEA